MLCSHRVHLQHPVQRHAIEAGSLENHGTYLDVWPLLWNITFGPSNVQTFILFQAFFLHGSTMLRWYTQIHCRYTAVMSCCFVASHLGGFMAHGPQNAGLRGIFNWGMEPGSTQLCKLVSRVNDSQCSQNGLYQAVLWIPEPSILMSGTGKSPSDSCILATGEVGELIAFRLSTSKGG